MAAWPPHLPVAQVRVARPSARFDEVVRFYRDALGLPVVASFEGHAGYDGVMLGLPATEVHLEITRHATGTPRPAPTPEDLLVLYVPDEAAWASAVGRLRAHGHEPVEPENPYWRGWTATFEDPDGWRLVLARSPGLPPRAP